MEHYKLVLGLTGEVKIFPKNEILKAGQKGSGINIGYFGNERHAYGKDGGELDLDGFLALAEERQSFGQILANRDLVTEPMPGQAEDKGGDLCTTRSSVVERASPLLGDQARGQRSIIAHTCSHLRQRIVRDKYKQRKVLTDTCRAMIAAVNG